MSKVLERKKLLKEGEIIPTYYDEAFKIMYANKGKLYLHITMRLLK